MSEFLKFAYEVLSQVVYNIVTWLAGFLTLFITGWVQYFNIFFTYFPTLSITGKILSVILMMILIAIPILLLVIIVRHAILRHQLKTDKSDNAALYKEIGRLNKQVLSLMDEKNSILALKVNAMGGTERIPYMGASALTDDVIPTVDAVTNSAANPNMQRLQRQRHSLMESFLQEQVVQEHQLFRLFYPKRSLTLSIVSRN